MKKTFVAKCHNYQQVKVENKRPYSVAQNIALLQLKWR